MANKNKITKEELGPLQIAELGVIEEYLLKHKGNIVQASKELNLNRNTTAKLIKRYGIDVRALRPKEQVGRLPGSKNGVWPQ